jgi:hypothetical protein
MFALLAACTRPSLPEPVVERAVPSFAWNGDVTTISLLGQDFWPQIEVDARGGGASINPTYRARLEGPDGATTPQIVPLLGVGIVDDTHLTATVPSGLPAGVWSLVVESPSSDEVFLPGGFRVTDQQAARLLLASSRLVYSAGQSATVDVKLLDVDDQVVPLPFEVVIVGTSGSGLVSLDPGTLASVRPTPSGDGLRGNLTDGRASIDVTPAAPGRVDLVVAAGDPYSTVVTDTLSLLFEPGEDLSVELTLPAGPFVAGEGFVVSGRVVDQFGNPIPDMIQVSLRTPCSGWFGTVALSGETLFEVVPTLASSPTCPEDEIVVVDPGNLSGRSPPFVVDAGPASRLMVQPDALSVRAGDPLSFLVTPTDPYGNETAWAATASLTASTSGLVELGCTAFGDARVCATRLTRAAPEVFVQVVGDDGVSGVSTAIEVLPDDELAGLALRAAGVATAGVPLPVLVSPLDAWGNVVPSAATTEDYTFSDDLGDLLCDRVGTAGDGSAAFECTFLTARPDAQVAVELDGFVAQAPVAVQNGALAVVTVSAPPAATAGVAVTVSFDGADAFGNPYLVQDDATLQLSDESGSFGSTQVDLDAAGRAEVSAAFTAAGSTRVAASQLGAVLGRSDVIAVAPGPTIGLRATVGAWAWVDEATPVTVEAVDDFGNRTNLDVLGLVSSRATATPDLAVPIVNGVGTGAFTWSGAALPDVLELSAGGYSGEAEVIVVRRCPGGPTAGMVFGGLTEGVACATGADGGAVVADLSSSSRGALAIARYAVSVNGAPGALDPLALIPVVLPGLGRHDVTGLVIDTASCADEVAGIAWSAPDDGSPAGLLPLEASVAPLPVLGVATIELLGVTDCAGNPAAGGDVLLSTTGGLLSSAFATGEGLAVTLDANGDASTPLDTSAGGLSATTLTVVAASAGGTARGELALPITGDVVRPVVVSASPVGSQEGLADTFVIRFSEPLQAASVVPTNFTVGGAAPVTAALAGDEVTLTTAAPLDGALGPHVLTASSLLRDAAGNRLAGDWGTGPAGWQSAFGGSAAAPEAPRCDEVIPPSLRFRPDGDDGASEEADRVSILASVSAPPSWWVVEVYDDVGALVDLDWEIPLTATDLVSWDGRGHAGTVLPPGRYEVHVAAADGLGNQGASCVTDITLEGR